MPKLAGDHVQVLVGGYELTGDSNRVTIDDAVDTLDATAFGHAVHNFVPGQRKMSLDHAGYLNPNTAGSHPVLKGNVFSGVVSVILGQNIAPVVGDAMYSLTTEQTKYSTMPEINKVIPFGALFSNRGDAGGWGKALAVGATFTNTTNGTVVDNGVATSNGGIAYLHVLTAAASDTYSIIIQGSTTLGFASPVTLGTFTLNASVIGSERILLAGTIQQYVRFTATRLTGVGGTVKISVNLARF